MKKLLIIAIIFAFCPLISLAAEYDLYVSEDGVSGGDGSQEKPFREIEKAVQKAKSRSAESRKIHIEKGTYNENLILSDSIKLYGDSKETVISGEIRMGDNTLLKGLTVSNGSVNVTVEKDASVTIENCSIKNAGTIGIETLAGKGKLTVKNSNISSNKTKGFYIQDGKKLEITGSTVSGNKEEGIDIRAYTSGIISGNSIYGNGESGIEIVAGGASIEINNNTSKNNKASGIAVQFYAESNKTGMVQIKNNKLNGNGKYGLDCASPHSKDTPALFFKNSITATSNIWQGNGLGTINSFCHIKESGEIPTSAIKTDEANLSRDKAAEETKKLEEEKRLEEERRLEEEKRLAEEKQRKQEEAKYLIGEQIAVEKEIGKEIETLAKKNTIAVFFMGVDKEKLINVQEKISISQMKIQKIKEVKDYVENVEEINVSLSNRERVIREQEDFVKKQLSRFSLLGWFSILFSFWK